MPKKKQPLQLQNLAVVGISDLVKRLVKNFVSLKLDEAETQVRLRPVVEWLKDYIFTDVRWSLVDDISVEVAQTISDFTKNSGDRKEPGFTNDTVVIAKVVTEILLHPRLQKLDLTSCSSGMQEVLAKNLHFLTGLKVLNIDFERVVPKIRSFDGLIVNGLRSMPNIVKLTLSTICNNDILTVVADNCTKLRFLDISDSYAVTDTGVMALVQCKELREINLEETMVTHKGLVKLLCELPFLESFDGAMEFGGALENVPNKTTFNIRTLRISRLTDDQLQLLVEYCPKLQHLGLDLNEKVKNITILEKLEELNVIELKFSKFYTYSISTLLEKIGKSLNTLHLGYVDEIDADAMKHIGMHCPNLNTLELNCCDIGGSLKSIEYNPKKPLFENIKSLYCVVESDVPHLEFLLANCPNVESIYLGSDIGITDVTVSNVLMKNPMKCLKVFDVSDSENLSMHAVRSLMSSCENLQKLTDLQTWERVTKTELTKFRDELRSQNIDLDTTGEDYIFFSENSLTALLAINSNDE